MLNAKNSYGVLTGWKRTRLFFEDGVETTRSEQNQSGEGMTPMLFFKR